MRVPPPPLPTPPPQLVPLLFVAFSVAVICRFVSIDVQVQYMIVLCSSVVDRNFKKCVGDRRLMVLISWKIAVAISVMPLRRCIPGQILPVTLTQSQMMIDMRGWMDIVR